jgi:hypothetical protein
MLAGASMVRVHDVTASVQAATLVGPARLSADRTAVMSGSPGDERTGGGGT